MANIYEHKVHLISTLFTRQKKEWSTFLPLWDRYQCSGPKRYRSTGQKIDHKNMLFSSSLSSLFHRLYRFWTHRVSSSGIFWIESPLLLHRFEYLYIFRFPYDIFLFLYLFLHYLYIFTFILHLAGRIPTGAVYR